MPEPDHDPQPARCYRFGIFEADAATGELRRKGVRVKLNAQPFQILLMLLERPGELLTRDDISRQLWPDGTFVDYDHGVNSAVNRIREALGDTAGNPRFIETLARRGYRFIAPVEEYRDKGTEGQTYRDKGNEETREPESRDKGTEGQRDKEGTTAELTSAATADSLPEPRILDRILAGPEDLPRSPHRVVQTLFLLLQAMYLGFYVGALANLAEIRELISPLAHPEVALNILIVTAAILIPVRAFVLCAVLFHAPGIQRKFLRLWPLLLLVDVLWALSPFLLLHHIEIGVALACMVLLVYSPFAQRSLVLMGAGEKQGLGARD